MCHVNTLFFSFGRETIDSKAEVFGVSGVKVAEQRIILVGTQWDLIKGVLLIEVLDD